MILTEVDCVPVICTTTDEDRYAIKQNRMHLPDCVTHHVSDHVLHGPCFEVALLKYHLRWHLMRSCSVVLPSSNGTARKPIVTQLERVPYLSTTLYNTTCLPYITDSAFQSLFRFERRGLTRLITAIAWTATEIHTQRNRYSICLTMETPFFTSSPCTYRPLARLGTFFIGGHHTCLKYFRNLRQVCDYTDRASHGQTSWACLSIKAWGIWKGHKREDRRIEKSRGDHRWDGISGGSPRCLKYAAVGHL